MVNPKTLVKLISRPINGDGLKFIVDLLFSIQSPKRGRIFNVTKVLIPGMKIRNIVKKT
jgi:hypothetical protein